MSFRHQMNDHFNQFPDHIRRNQTVRALTETITLSYENLFRVIGPVAIRVDINWNHIVEMLRGSVDIGPENIQNYIDRFRLDSDFIISENEQPFENENNDLSSHISEIQGYAAAESVSDDDESDSDAESDSDSESDSNDESSTDDDNSHNNGTDENLWGCAHCEIFIGNYDDVCTHENECLLNHSRNEP